MVKRSHFIVLFWRILFFLALYSVGRLFFFLFHLNHFVHGDLSDLAKAFGLGALLDLNILIFINSVNIILSVIPIASWQNSSSYRKMLKVIFLVTNIPFLILGFVDLELYRVSSRRFTYDMLLLFDDLKQQLYQMAVNFWYLSFLVFFAIYFISKIFPNDSYEYASSKNKNQGMGIFGVIVLFVIANGYIDIKGSVINSSEVFTFKTDDLAYLTLNTSVSVINSYQRKYLENFKLTYSHNELKKYLYNYFKQPIHSSKEPLKDNVVIIILESFNREYMGEGNGYAGYTPFLDSLAKAGKFFAYHHANGQRSIDAVPSILYSLPLLNENSIINSPYEQNHFVGLPHIFEGLGYETYFFHGGHEGTMGFKRFTTHNGIKHYIGLEQYPYRDKDFDGTWGIWDEPFLSFFAKTLTQSKKPFFAGIFTLSSHQPYAIPEKYKGKFSKGDLPIHEAIGYTDFALKNFFEQIKDLPWYKNTLFVITADHVSLNSRKEYRNVSGKFRVPLIFFHPGRELAFPNLNRVSQHVDIAPTILDLLNISSCRLPLMGHSLLQDDVNAQYALNRSGNLYRFIRKNYVIEWYPGQRVLAHKNLPELQKVFYPDLTLDQLKDVDLMSFLTQYYNQALNQDTLAESHCF